MVQSSVDRTSSYRSITLRLLDVLLFEVVALALICGIVIFIFYSYDISLVKRNDSVDSFMITQHRFFLSLKML